ncbi:prepilin-type N-terminal cleavage/methylation domain-containing protein [Puniceicoccus vermicola]|uniref:Prepilin-type N-terminal cleavage/methylation domain-containing protein n=1 Tax=Puniceicoccus vermicola TaxID=388746 RepID=A0A7X1E5S4_9BACT|nr:prepilin-type N-terminal cleavage/methylation domain-containing protein [Puniceicoccus vermicola]MBC2603363.1 prepilin-type N-terminal cleavage/methylation domain-containing protein [Puniceicoccus vermicola]
MKRYPQRRYPSCARDTSWLSRSRQRKAFSLIELLTVITIIGILASIVFASVSHIRALAQSSKCAANLKQLHAAATLWGADHKHRMPDNRFWAYNGEPGSNSYPYQLAPYLGFENMSIGDDPGEIASAMRCPASESETPSTQQWDRTYSINNHATSTSEGKVRSDRWYPASIHQIAHPARMALFMDGTVSPGSGSYWTNAQNTQVDSGGSGAVLSYPHDGTMNVVFVDGHVERFSKEVMVAQYSEAYIPFWRYNEPPE